MMPVYDLNEIDSESGSRPDVMARQLEHTQTTKVDRQNRGKNASKRRIAKGAEHQLVIRKSKDEFFFGLASPDSWVMVAMPIILTLCAGGLMWLKWYLNHIGG